MLKNAVKPKNMVVYSGQVKSVINRDLASYFCGQHIKKEEKDPSNNSPTWSHII